MTQPRPNLRVGALRPNQLLHTYGIGSVADLPSLSVMVLGLDQWDLARAALVTEDRLLSAMRAKLGRQVQALRLPPHLPETSDPFAEWARVGVPVALFPGWLRCSDTRCNRLARADAGFFELLPHSYLPDKVRYVHSCRGQGGRRPTAVPARFVMACGAGHLNDFPWSYFVHRGTEPGAGHSLKLSERGSTGEAVNIFVSCDECGQSRPLSDAIGVVAEQNLPACRGRHPHLGTYEQCDAPTRTLALGATNSWFAMQLRVFSLPRAEHPVDHVVADYWQTLSSRCQRRPRARCCPRLRWASMLAGVDAQLIDAQDLTVPADHGQIFVQAHYSALPDEWDDAEDENPAFMGALDEAWDSGRFVAACRYCLNVLTPGQWNSHTPVRLEVWSAEPPDDREAWDHEVDLDFDVPEGRLDLGGPVSIQPGRAHMPPGRYRVRVCGRGYTAVGAAGANGTDSHRLWLWARQDDRAAVLRRFWPGWVPCPRRYRAMIAVVPDA
jgi:hypothetical protein